MKTGYYLLTRMTILLTIPMLFSACGQSPKDRTPWNEIFDGQTLKGWHTQGGDADYRIEEGAIVGSTVFDPKSISTFLMSDNIYEDFILELETKVDSDMNSGILIRCNSNDYFQNDRVYGYQVEIDPSDRAWSGGIYESAKRGWLYTLENNPDAQKAFKKEEWNHYRIEFIGDTLKTWINGVPAAHLIDDRTHKGYIALQVHGIKKDEPEGSEVMWKNIKILTENLDEHVTKTPLPPLNTSNRLTIKEKENGWKMLWDGKTSKGWRGAKLDTFPEKGWAINNGSLEVLTSGGSESAGGGDIITNEQFGDFELKIDFKINSEKEANSGIKYYVDTGLNKVHGSAIGLEYQILGIGHPGNAKSTHRMASLYDLIEANPRPVNPTDEWNTVRIVSRENHVQHWLNGVKVLEYERGSKNFRELVSKSKYAKIPGFGELEKGHILLQDHGSYTAFKNIKIKEY